MQNIEFETDQGSPSLEAYMTPKKSFMVGLLEKFGIKDTATANIILIAIAAIFFGVTIYLYSDIFNKTPERTPQQLKMDLMRFEGTASVRQ